jgi:hypothetical protein
MQVDDIAGIASRDYYRDAGMTLSNISPLINHGPAMRSPGAKPTTVVSYKGDSAASVFHGAGLIVRRSRITLVNHDPPHQDIKTARNTILSPSPPRHNVMYRPSTIGSSIIMFLAYLPRIRQLSSSILYRFSPFNTLLFINPT